MNKLRWQLFALAFFFVYLVFVLDHTAQNLLSYDETHGQGLEHFAIEFGESAGPGSPTWRIAVDLDAYRLHVYKGDALIRTYPCSGGKPSTPSPTGDFKIVSKDAWGEGFGGAWLGLDVPWGQYGIHGTRFPWIIGKKHASKGCIRLRSQDAKELYRMVPYGTPVRITQQNRAFRELKSGDIGSDVRELQLALAELGFYEGRPDGRFGILLFRAIAGFQMRNGLPQTGKADQKTHACIFRQWKEMRE